MKSNRKDYLKFFFYGVSVGVLLWITCVGLVIALIVLWVIYSQGQKDKLWAAVGTSIGGGVNLIVVVVLTKWLRN